MKDRAWREVALAVCLSGLAGYVDALGFLRLGGLFVSFMSGNSTRLAVGLGQGDAGRIATLAGILASFVLGAALGAWAGHFAGRRRRPAVLLLVTALLAAAAVLDARGWTAYAVCVMALTMGAENAVFQDAREGPIGLTYMTGALVKVGQGIAGAFTGGPPFLWVRFVLLWAGLVTGGVVGTLAFGQLGLAGLWAAVAWCGGLTAAAALLGGAGPSGRRA